MKRVSSQRSYIIKRNDFFFFSFVRAFLEQVVKKKVGKKKTVGAINDSSAGLRASRCDAALTDPPNRAHWAPSAAPRPVLTAPANPAPALPALPTRPRFGWCRPPEGMSPGCCLPEEN